LKFSIKEWAKINYILQTIVCGLIVYINKWGFLFTMSEKSSMRSNKMINEITVLTAVWTVALGILIMVQFIDYEKECLNCIDNMKKQYDNLLLILTVAEE